jgi:hypothetical protein
MMVARLFSIAAAGFIAAGCSIAAAGDIAGRYIVVGTLTSGRQYVGAAQIVMTSEITCEIKWREGSNGLCILEGTILSVATVVHGELQVGLYHVASDGTIEGVFIDKYHLPKGLIERS